jgi:glucose/mannose-6-phosphate isomerase
MTEIDLDQTADYGRVDSSDMLGHIRALPAQCTAAWDLVQAVRLPPAYEGVQHVVVVGIGGSAMGATAVQGLVSGESAVPISVVRDYSLPAYVRGPNYLVVGCSYSGNTEETLSAMSQALARGVRAVAVTTGGQLADLARRESMPVVGYEYHSQPRAALGYSLVLLLGVCSRLGLVGDYGADIAEATRVMEAWQREIDAPTATVGNAAKSLAVRIGGLLPVIYGAGHLLAAANRWKTQFNENAKSWSYFEPMPELQHNSVVGFDSAQPVGDETFVVMLCSDLDHPRTTTRWQITEEMLSSAGVAVERVTARGESRLAQLLSLIHFGDYVSYYLSLLKGKDPTPVEAINYLKRRLAGQDKAQQRPYAAGEHPD